MKSTTAAVIALGALATVVPACAQESHSHSHSHSSECTAEFLTSAKSACDSVADVSQLKCDDEGCHEALHSLVEDEVRQCYVDLGLGPATDLDYYVQLDEFCHGDGADPADLAATSNTTASSSGSGAGAATVGDHDHDHDHHDHDHHDHDHDESEASASASADSAAPSLSASMVALQVVALIVAALHL